MDVVYDHVQEQTLPSPDPQDDSGKSTQFKSEVQSAFQSLASSSWGQTLTSAYHNIEELAKKEITELRSEISELSDSISLSKNTETSGNSSSASPLAISRLLQSAQRVSLKDLEKVEVSAESYLRGFGASLGSFIKEVVTVTSPLDEKVNLLFEANIDEPSDSQLHAFNTRKETYTVDPSHEDFPQWKADFTIDKYQERIEDLKTIPEIVKMRALLPITSVSNNDFWMRYLFSRKVYEESNSTNQAHPCILLSDYMLSQVSSPEEDVSWESDNDKDQEKTPSLPNETAKSTATLKPGSRNSRLSSDGSYDVVNPMDQIKSEGSDDDWE